MNIKCLQSSNLQSSRPFFFRRWLSGWFVQCTDYFAQTKACLLVIIDSGRSLLSVIRTFSFSSIFTKHRQIDKIIYKKVDRTNFDRCASRKELSVDIYRNWLIGSLFLFSSRVRLLVYWPNCSKSNFIHVYTFFLMTNRWATFFTLIRPKLGERNCCLTAPKFDYITIQYEFHSMDYNTHFSFLVHVNRHIYSLDLLVLRFGGRQ